MPYHSNSTWAAQILSALAWAQVALASDYGRMVVMCALHKAVRRVYHTSPWGAENSMPRFTQHHTTSHAPTVES